MLGRLSVRLEIGRFAEREVDRGLNENDPSDVESKLKDVDNADTVPLGIESDNIVDGIDVAGLGIETEIVVEGSEMVALESDSDTVVDGSDRDKPGIDSETVVDES